MNLRSFSGTKVWRKLARFGQRGVLRIVLQSSNGTNTQGHLVGG
jgi:hypothetical protein